MAGNVKSRNVDINEQDEKGQTVLHRLIDNKFKKKATKQIEKLLEDGVNPNIQDSRGETALHLAIDNRKPSEFIKILLENGADPNIQAYDGATALHQAVREKPSEIMQLLLEKGANPNLQLRHDGETPLHWATSLGNYAAYKDLLLAGADPKIKTKMNKVADDLIRENKPEFDKVKQEVNTLKGVAALQEIHPEAEMLKIGNVYDQMDAESIIDLHRYMGKGGKQRRKSTKRRKSAKRR
jgi:ankyrin repeat protein